MKENLCKWQIPSKEVFLFYFVCILEWLLFLQQSQGVYLAGNVQKSIQRIAWNTFFPPLPDNIAHFTGMFEISQKIFSLATFLASKRTICTLDSLKFCNFKHLLYSKRRCISRTATGSEEGLAWKQCQVGKHTFPSNGQIQFFISVPQQYNSLFFMCVFHADRKHFFFLIISFIYYFLDKTKETCFHMDLSEKLRSLGNALFWDYFSIIN